jgi:hypothetical protein
LGIQIITLGLRPLVIILNSLRLFFVTTPHFRCAVNYHKISQLFFYDSASIVPIILSLNYLPIIIFCCFRGTLKIFQQLKAFSNEMAPKDPYF